MLICAILTQIRFEQIYQKGQVQEFFTLQIEYIIYINIVIFICFRRAELVCLFVLNANIRFVWKACSCLLNLSKYIFLYPLKIVDLKFFADKILAVFCSIRRKKRFLSHVFRFSKFILGH